MALLCFVNTMSVYDLLLAAGILVNNLILLVNEAYLYSTVAIILHGLYLSNHAGTSLKHGYGNEHAIFKKAGVSSKRYVREFKFENAEEYTLGAEIKADIFAAGDKVDASAISKGKGFQGAIKRFGQHRGPMAHGSKFHRHQGSNGACSSPSRVFKGKGMPGHMGCVKVTVQNLEVVRVDAEKNLLLVKGAVPGPKKALVTIKETVKVEA